MSHAPTFDRNTAEPCRCVSQHRSLWGVQALLFLIGVSVVAGVVFLMAGITPISAPVLPSTPSVARSWSVSPSPTTAVLSSPTPNPLIPPTYQIVIVTTPTPAPTATMTAYQQLATAVVMTQVAGKVPQDCGLTTVTAEESRICYWPTETPTPPPTPAYQTCSTPVPGAYCLKEA